MFRKLQACDRLRQFGALFLIVVALLCAIASQYSQSVIRNEQLAAFLLLLACLLWLPILVRYRDFERPQRLNIKPQLAPDVQVIPGIVLTLFGLMIFALVFWVAFRLHNRFTLLLLLLWISGIVYWWKILTLNHAQRQSRHIPTGQLSLIIFVMLIASVFQLFSLVDAPLGMTADHLEKIFDLVRIRNGEYPVYFTLNSGREPLHFYATYAASSVFGLSFMSLKWVSAAIATMTVAALFPLGRHLGGQRLGLVMMAFAAMSVWLMLIGRSGFRAGGAALLSALFLAAFWLAIQHDRRRDYVISGLLLGAGQYTYTAFRIVPLLVVFALIMKLMLASKRERRRILLDFAALVIMAVMVYLPMFVYWLHEPDMYWYRSRSMLDSSGNSLSGFAAGLSETLAMFNLVTDPVELNTVPAWPTLGPVAGALLPIGLILWCRRIWVRRAWLDSLLPAALLIFLLSSALGYSAPREMPSSRRAILAFPIVMIFVAYGWLMVCQMLQQKVMNRRAAGRFVSGFMMTLLLFHGSINWWAYFESYTPLQNRKHADQVIIQRHIQQFVQTGRSVDSVVLLFSEGDYWIDSRLVAVWLGYPLAWDNKQIVTRLDACEPELADDEPRLIIYSMLDAGLHAWLNRCYHVMQPQIVGYAADDPMFRSALITAGN